MYYENFNLDPFATIKIFSVKNQKFYKLYSNFLLFSLL